jgi:hypothetical protein
LSDEPKSQSMDDKVIDRAMTALTTEHFVLQTARTATVNEANGRVSVFLGAVSGALITLGFVAQASQLGTAFNVIALLLLPVLAYLGLVTQERVLQTGLEDAAYARRISQVRRFYADTTPEIDPYFTRPDPGGGAGAMPGDVPMRMARLQVLLSTAGMVAVVTSVLVGATAGIIARASGATFAVACPVGAVVGLAAAALMIVRQMRTWRTVSTEESTSSQ